ncbi:MAG TPA: glycosyltransferase family 4 protein [Humidesulfovibrio sp.]|uniref:glycosyltransferase family 4 protein n=1 Tax=Humidesulfovibrio sp. TaxID=2910988 RepID=UPI002B87AF1D|nr:glycosyltransferase family 4 protein [Humidesulfovibrio sp.]HWR02670.1 glycosyltransferase family 4 protein [Humidesulfovibrio sp.]
MLHNLTLSFLDQYGSLGGGQQVLLELVVAALDLGARVTVLAPRGPLLAAAGASGAETRVLPELSLRQGRKGPADMLRLGLWTGGLLARHARFLSRQELIYVNGLRCLPAVMGLSAVAGTPFCIHTHLAHCGLERRLLLAASRQDGCLALVAPSSFAAGVLEQDGRSLPKLRVLENGLGAAFGGLANEDRHSDSPLREVLVIGRLSPEKGQDALVEAASALPGLRFHFLGAADFADEDFAKALSRLMPGNAVFHGRVADVPAAARSLGAQVCLVPSRCAEAFGLAAVEGMALSCVTAVRDSGGLAEIAAATGALRFRADAEILPLLRSLADMPGPERAALARAQHGATLARYGHASFAERLRAHLKGLIAAAAAGGR